jgi:ABC-type transport system substrate-binding protein
MTIARKLLFVGSAAAVALVCSASGAGLLQTAADLGAQTGLDDLGRHLTVSIAQWQPASGYVPAEYPTDGSWERMVASAGH